MIPGLLLGVDEPLGYDNVPDEFRAFLTWGVDGVHEGLWIDDVNQPHPPHVVMASPTDFDDPIRLEAAKVEEWLALVEPTDSPNVLFAHLGGQPAISANAALFS